MNLLGLIFNAFPKMRTQCGHAHIVFPNIYSTFAAINLQLLHRPICGQVEKYEELVKEQAERRKRAQRANREAEVLGNQAETIKTKR